VLRPGPGDAAKPDGIAIERVAEAAALDEFLGTHAAG